MKTKLFVILIKNKKIRNERKIWGHRKNHKILKIWGYEDRGKIKNPTERGGKCGGKRIFSGTPGNTAFWRSKKKLTLEFDYFDKKNGNR